MPQGMDTGTVGATKTPPWEALGIPAGLTPEQSYALWQKAEKQGDGSIASTSAIFAKALQTTTAAPTTTAPPGGPSSTAGGGGGAASAAAKQQAINAASATFANMVRTWGIVISPQLQHLIDSAARSGWNTAQFTRALRGTKEYHQQFPGIRWKQGMSEATYNSQYRAYLTKAQDAGYHLSRQAFGHTLKKGIDSAEWALRVSAVKQIEANRPLLENFREELVARGLQKPNDKLNPKELYKFVTGRGSQAWTAIWNTASVETGLEGIGVTVGRGSNTTADISRKELAGLLKGPISRLDPGSTVDVDYANLAAEMAAVLPASQLYRAGITKKMLVKEALGDPSAAGTKSAVTRVLATAHERFNESEQARGPQIRPGGGYASQQAPAATE